MIALCRRRGGRTIKGRKRGRRFGPATGPAALEVLESRVLLSAGAVWTIHGDLDKSNPSDVIVVEQTDPDGDLGLLAATVNGRVVATRDASSLRKIRVLAGKGDDTVRADLGESNTNIRVRIVGGPGDDQLTGSDGPDVLMGGRGADALSGGDEADRLDGGRGDDMLEGGRGADRIRGGAGNDELHGNAGGDVLYGGRGTDMIYGQPDVDFVRRARHDGLVGDSHSNRISRLMSQQALHDWLTKQGLSAWEHVLGTTRAKYEDGGLGLSVLVGGPFGGPLILNSTLEADAPGFSQTNNQVDGVDEPDLVKTDGHYIYTLFQGELIIIDATPVEELGVVSRTAMRGDARKMFLSGDRLTVLSQTYIDFLGPPVPVPLPVAGGVGTVVAAEAFFAPIEPTLTVTVFDVSNAQDPTLLEETQLEGSLVDARAIEDRVYVVVNNPFALPQPLVFTNEDGDSVFEDEDDYRQRLEAMDLNELLPQFVTTTGGQAVFQDDYRQQSGSQELNTLPPQLVTTTGGERVEGSLVAAPNLFVPDLPDLRQILSVVMFDVGDDTPGLTESTSAMGVWGDVYASTQNLYIAMRTYWRPATSSNWGPTTHIYKFALGEPGLPLEATGSVAGSVLDQFSMDEHEGFFRVATTGRDDARTPSNNVFVLQQREDELKTVGSVTGLAPTETIHSARFMGDRGVVVTFRRVDPLFTLDLSDPFAPSVEGILKIPGFSSYLQPVAENHLLGIGQDADERGVALGLQLGLFDLSNLSDPQRIDVVTFAGRAYSEAQFNHHAVSYYPQAGVVALPVTEGFWPDVESSLKVYQVSADDGLELIGHVKHGDSRVRRSLRIGDLLYSLSDAMLKVNELDDPDLEVGSVPLGSVDE